MPFSIHSRCSCLDWSLATEEAEGAGQLLRLQGVGQGNRGERNCCMFVHVDDIRQVMGAAPFILHERHIIIQCQCPDWLATYTNFIGQLCVGDWRRVLTIESSRGLRLCLMT